MGMITITTPENVSLNYTIEDVETLNSVIEELEDIACRKKIQSFDSKIIPPKISWDEAMNLGFGILADDEESGMEISRRVREANRKIT